MKILLDSVYFLVTDRVSNYPHNNCNRVILNWVENSKFSWWKRFNKFKWTTQQINRPLNHLQVWICSKFKIIVCKRIKGNFLNNNISLSKKFSLKCSNNSKFRQETVQVLSRQKSASSSRTHQGSKCNICSHKSSSNNYTICKCNRSTVSNEEVEIFVKHK